MNMDFGRFHGRNNLTINNPLSPSFGTLLAGNVTGGGVEAGSVPSAACRFVPLPRPATVTAARNLLCGANTP